MSEPRLKPMEQTWALSLLTPFPGPLPKHETGLACKSQAFPEPR